MNTDTVSSPTDLSSITATQTETPAGFSQPRSEEELQAHIDAMRAFFNTGATLDVSFRLQQLTRLKAWLKLHEGRVLDALETWAKHPSKDTPANWASFMTRSISRRGISANGRAPIQSQPHSPTFRQHQRSTPRRSVWQPSLHHGTTPSI